MAQEILCEVNNCTFWDSGNKCTAEKFMLSAKRDNMLPTVRKQTVKHSNLKRINAKRVTMYMVTLFPLY